MAWTPTLQVKTVGWDTNVFNSVSDQKTDFTAVGGPQFDWWLRAGRMRVHGTNTLDYVYFQEYESERSLNQNHRGNIEFRLGRFVPYVGGGYVDTKDRPGFEIDARARHTESEARGGLVARFTAKTRLDLSAYQRTYQFTGDEALEGTYLSDVLNRTAVGGSGSLSIALTPLTTFTVLVESGREEFERTPDRNHRTLRVLPGLQFSPDALLKGNLRVGYRRISMDASGVQDFSGLVADTNLSLVVAGSTRVNVGVSRDVQFSFERIRPYYVQTGVTGSVRQGVGRGFDFEARGAYHWLDYRNAVGESANVTPRKDKVLTAGGGVGYRLGPDVRLSVNSDYSRRTSPLYGRGYEGLRTGLAVTYGF